MGTFVATPGIYPWLCHDVSASMKQGDYREFVTSDTKPKPPIIRFNNNDTTYVAPYNAICHSTNLTPGEVRTFSGTIRGEVAEELIARCDGNPEKLPRQLGSIISSIALNPAPLIDETQVFLGALDCINEYNCSAVEACLVNGARTTDLIGYIEEALEPEVAAVEVKRIKEIQKKAAQIQQENGDLTTYQKAAVRTEIMSHVEVANDSDWDFQTKQDYIAKHIALNNDGKERTPQEKAVAVAAILADNYEHLGTDLPAFKAAVYSVKSREDLKFVDATLFGFGVWRGTIDMVRSETLWGEQADLLGHLSRVLGKKIKTEFNLFS